MGGDCADEISVGAGTTPEQSPVEEIDEGFNSDGDRGNADEACVDNGMDVDSPEIYQKNHAFFSCPSNYCAHSLSPFFLYYFFLSF